MLSLRQWDLSLLYITYVQIGSIVMRAPETCFAKYSGHSIHFSNKGCEAMSVRGTHMKPEWNFGGNPQRLVALMDTHREEECF